MNKIIDIATVIDSPSALTQEQGEKIYSIIADSITRKEQQSVNYTDHLPKKQLKLTCI